MRLAEKKLLRKIDFQLMPILILIYILNYLDRNNITTARNRGFVKDLGLTDTEYQTALSLLYVGYITLQIPSNLFMAKVGRPSLYLPCCVAAWGVVSGCTALCENFHQLIVVRIFLGMVEAAFFPGALFLLSKWYKKSEIATRTALLFSGSIISNAFSGLVSAGILGGMDGKAGHAGWKWLFIIEGSITVVVAVLAIFILPDFPHNSKFLTEEERQMAQRRLSLDAGESDNEGDSGGAWAGFLLAVRDVKVWILALMLTSCTVGLAFNQFMPTLTATLEYNKTVTLLLTAPIWFFAFIICLLNGLHSDKVGERTMHIIVPLSVGCAGFIISSATMNLGGRFFALFIEASSYAAYTCILGWIAPSIPRPVYKRATALALINAFSQLGNISGSYVWPQKWGPRYWQSNVISLSMFMTTIALVLVHRFMLQRENRELDRSRGPVGTPIGAKSTGEGARYPNALVLEEDIQGVSRSQNISIEKAMQARADFRYML
ncbi:MFS general substrate transporter [Violaceomyces palustris]|uniref:MFS general substrate transporter n=1 Tax=Violaceomyces palustris TaxID=1673888 RepID=A0ACD0NMJ1_9BASI|nr:MFS general substrate transporter [Violaceomyces palustris]